MRQPVRTGAAWAVRAGRIVRNAAIDLRFRAVLSGRTRSEYEHLGSRHVVNSDYRGLDRIFSGRLRPEDVLVDVGCGRGRVINWWLANGFAGNRIVGLELDPAVAEKTRKRLRHYSNVTIVTGDAIDNLPPDASLLYLYNPFDATVMRRLSERVKDLYAESGVRILYYNCKHVALFEEDPAFVVALETVGGGPAPFDPLADIELAVSSGSS